MEKQAEVLKTNLDHLKACILYEVLQKKPVNDSYRNFCKIIGEGVMDYFDFEYWFYRFHNGNCDFNHDRSQDPKQKALVELPAEILSMIFEEIEPMERVSFSTVCKTIKGICKITPTKLKDVKVIFVKNFFAVFSNKMRFRYTGGEGVPSKLQINNEPEREIQGDFLIAGRETARRVFSMPHLRIENLTLFVRERNSDLSLPDNLHVKSVIIRESEPNAVFGNLEHLQSGTLERIKLNSFDQPENLALLLGSRHFLEAKEVNIPYFGTVATMQELRQFSHLTRFEVSVDNITPEIAVGIQEMLSTSKAFKSCVIRSNKLNVAEICWVLGANSPIEPDESPIVTHRSRMEGSRDFLEFKISASSIRVEKVH